MYQKVAKRFQVLLQLEINWTDLKTFPKTIFYTALWRNIVHAEWLQKQLCNITQGKDKRGCAFEAAWPSGKAEDCKSSIPSSNPGVAYCVYNRSQFSQWEKISSILGLNRSILLRGYQSRSRKEQ